MTRIPEKNNLREEKFILAQDSYVHCLHISRLHHSGPKMRQHMVEGGGKLSTHGSQEAEKEQGARDTG